MVLKKLIMTSLISCFLLAGCSSAAYLSMDAAMDRVESANENTEVLFSASSMEDRSFAEDIRIKGAQAVPVTTGMNCFSFSSDTKQYTDDQGNILLVEQIDDVAFVSSDAQLNVWINDFLADKNREDLHQSSVLYGYAQSSLNKLGDDQFYAYSHYVTKGIARHDNRIASLLSLSSIYSGGVHPNSIQTASNFDLANRVILKLEDVLIKDSETELTEIVKQKVSEKLSALGEEVLYDNFEDSIDKTMAYGSMTPYWYFNSDGLVIFFNQYELAPNAAGIIKAEISYEDLDGILKDEFYPEENPNSLTTKINQLDEPLDGSVILTADFGEGESSYLSVSGKVYGVQVSEVFFAEDTLVGQRMVLSADYIDETNTLEIIFDPSEIDRTYAITFNDLKGEPISLFIRSDGNSMKIDLAD